MSDEQPTGRYETRPWVSRVDPRLDGDIRVFIPEILHDTYHVADPEALREVERRLADVTTDATVDRMGPILTRSEGIASSRIEGLAMSSRRIYEAKQRPADIVDRQASQIVGNMDVMTEVLGGTDRPTAVADLNRWHEAVMSFEPQAVVGAIGTYRNVQNWIGGRTDTPVGADFVPPPPELVPHLMDDLIRFASRSTLSPIIQAAITHAQFETIHPYGDGNGRIGRALLYRVLASRSVIRNVAPPISPIIVRDRSSYVEGLTAYRNGNPSIWIDTFVRLLRDACSYSLLLGSALTDLEQSWKKRVEDTRGRAVDHRLVAWLMNNPILEATMVAGQFGISAVAARSALERLQQHRVLVERPLRKGKRGRPARVFEAAELFELIDEDPQTLFARRQSR